MNSIKTTNYNKTRKFIKEVIADNGYGAIIGEKGAGKTHMIREIIGEMEERKAQYTVIRITPMKEDEKNITQIMSAMIMEVSGEHVRRDTEARRRQLRRVLGDTTRKVILAVDEAQDLHKSTIRGLKKLHELGFGMRDKLFSIILFGQNSLKDRISCDELKPRIKRLQLQELTQEEKTEFIETPGLFTDEAMKIFLKRTRKTPLSIITAYNNLNEMREDLNRKKIDEQLVNDYFSVDLRHAILSLNKSYRRMANEIRQLTGEDVSATAINQHVKGSYKGNTAKLDRIMEMYVEKQDKVRIAQ